MPKTLLAVPHLRQKAESDCLPACAAMVLKFLGRDESDERLKGLLGTRWFGTPADNILRLEQLGIHVVLVELSLEQIAGQLEQGRPVIAFVGTADLSYWKTDTDHAVVLVGIDEQAVYLNDPFFAEAPVSVPRASLELAMLRSDNRCAVLEIQPDRG